MEKWVIIYFWPYEPAQVYGPFDTEEEAYAYIERVVFDRQQGAYQVTELRSIEP